MSFVYLQRNIQENWGKILFLGGFYLLLGFMAITFAGITTFASIAFLGLCLAIVGVAEIYFAVQTRKEGRVWYHGLFGLLAIVCGAFMFIAPVPNAIILTWTAAIFLLVRAVVQMAGSATERYPRWGWSFVDGLIAALFAGTILYLWPLSSFWLIGLLVGVSLMFHGAEFISLAAFGRRLKKIERQDLYPPSIKGETKKRDPDIENFY
jgi:uncharacterized membrane protein HdeD (DUF308 family)